MNYIVLVKQVPDIKNIPKEAWDWERGTLRRGLLDNVCNELDKQALAFALGMREKQPGNMVSLTMGPPFAEEVLRYALSVGADTGVLLTDRKLGGADTPATAYPLAEAIRKIEKELFGGDRNYVVVCGMQSIDGDTAQVPPQVAEELGIVHIAYATSFKFNNGHLHLQRITRRGTETVSPLSYPCMVTVTQWTQPPNTSFSRTRWAYSQKIYQWSASDINANESRIGLSGSKTNVVRIFSPREANQRNCILEKDVAKLARMLKEAYVNKSGGTEKKEQKAQYHLPEGKKPDYKGEVWVYAEQEDGEINPASFELLGKATELAGLLNEKVGAVLVGKGVKKLARELLAYGADRVYLAEHELLARFLPLPYSRTITELITKYKPQMMLFSATPIGRELGPRVAYRVGSGLTADCTGLDIVDLKRGDKEHTAILMQTRPALGGNIMASIVTQNSMVQMSTTRPGVVQALPPNYKRPGEVIEHTPNISESDLGASIVSAELIPLTSEIGEAVVIVCGGVGCKTKEGFDRYIYPLADSLSKFLGEKAMVGASRLAVEAGCINRSHQIGQTGQTVKPRLYLGVAVSGAVQHLTGMQNSDIIVAINKDPGARIFKMADFGIIGNLEEVVPELIKALNAKGV
ncbi:MAG: Electron transfer flavoprotein alpha/beta-subunit [Dehalococcoidales bacterium]|nr:Electron transfer flavoprotein alpha/beta-subunit [Dehalococcoidales bacterium]